MAVIVPTAPDENCRIPFTWVGTSTSVSYTHLAVIAYEGGVCKIYQNDGTILNLSDGSAPAVAPVLLEKGDAYAREIRYFTDCVKTGSFPNKVTPEELCAVATMLNQL